MKGESMSTTLASGPDEVIVLVGSNQFQGWQTVSISKSCETMPNSWSVTASAEFLQGAALAGTAPGQSCKIRIGSDLVITGWIDRRSIAVDAHNHVVTISGRGITRNLVDCSVDLVHDVVLRGGQLTCPNILDMAQKLCKSYGITARSAVSDLGPAIPGYQVAYGDTPYSIIETVARYAGFLVYEDSFGALVLDQVGTRSHASGFSMPGNIEALNAEQNVDRRYSEYIVVWFGIDQLFELNNLGNRRTLPRLDPTLGEFRLKLIVSEQIAAAPNQALQPVANNLVAERRRDWEYSRRLGRSQAVSITCDSWRDDAGVLWQPNWLAPIGAPAAGIGDKWIIGSVHYRKDLSGTHTDLILMPPAAFQPDPTVPNGLFVNQEFALSPTKSQAPVPPTTSPPEPATPAL